MENTTVIETVATNETVHRTLRDRVTGKTIKKMAVVGLAIVGAVALIKTVSDRHSNNEDVDTEDDLSD